MTSSCHLVVVSRSFPYLCGLCINKSAALGSKRCTSSDYLLNLKSLLFSPTTFLILISMLSYCSAAVIVGSALGFNRVIGLNQLTQLVVQSILIGLYIGVSFICEEALRYSNFSFVISRQPVLLTALGLKTLSLLLIFSNKSAIFSAIFLLNLP